MRALTVNERQVVQGGDYSDWETVTVATFSSAVSLGSFHAIRSCSLTQGLQVASAGGFLTFIAAISFTSVLGLLPAEVELSCLVAE